MAPRICCRKWELASSWSAAGIGAPDTQEGRRAAPSAALFRFAGQFGREAIVNFQAKPKQRRLRREPPTGCRYHRARLQQRAQSSIF